MSDSKETKFLIPSPTEVFLLVATAWAGICLVMMLSGNDFIRTLTRISRSAADVVKGQDLATLLPIVMVSGVLVIAASFSAFSRWEKFFLVALLVSFSFADSTWAAGHFAAFAVKYLIVIYLGAFGLFFVLRNWNRLSDPVHWLAAVQIAWMGISALYYGRINDIWYLGTQFTLVIAFGIGWMSRIDSHKRLMDFNILLAYTAMGVTVLHLLSPVLAPEVFSGGRFIASSPTATNFATTYALFVICMVWLTLAHPTPVVRRIAVVFSLVGVSMIVLSGTRNANGALVCAIILLSLTFRSRLVVYSAGIGAFAAIVAYLFVADTETVDTLGRMTISLSDTDSSTMGRIEIWEVYIQSSFQKPILGWGAGGQTGAYLGAEAQAFADKYTSRGFAPQAHNAMIGQMVRFGYVGLFLFIAMFAYAFWRAKQIFTDKGIPESLKVAYSLPVAILVTLFLEGAFEDNFATTRGSLVNVMYGTMVILVVMFADKIRAQVASGDLTPEQLEEIKPPEPTKKLVRI